MKKPRNKAAGGRKRAAVRQRESAVPHHVSHVPNLVDKRVCFDGAKQKLFFKAGYILLHKMLTQEGLSFLREKVDEIYQEKHPAVDGEWILNIHQVLPKEANWMWSLATDPFIVQMLDATLGPGSQLYASQLHRKAPASAAEGGGGHEVPWHQDGSDKVRTIWIALDPVDAHNGALRVLPGWHRQGRLPLKRVESLEELTAAEYMARNNVYQIDLEAAAAKEGGRTSTRKGSVVTYELPAGGGAMHHPQLPHSSLPNASPLRDRRVVILRFMARGEKLAPTRAQHWQEGRYFAQEAFTISAGAPPPDPAQLFDLPA